MFAIKPKPKIKLKKLIKDKELEIEKLPTDFVYKDTISEDDNVTVEVKTTVDINWQKQYSLTDRIKNFSFKFTKRF